MKKIVVILITTLLFPIQALSVTLPASTPIFVQPQYEIDADDYKVGDTVKFKVSKPVIVEEQILINTGTEVNAKILNKKNNGILGIPGKIEIGEFEIPNVNNKTIYLNGTIYDYGDNRYWANVGWIFLFPLLFIKGNDGKIAPWINQVLYSIDKIDL